MICPKCNVPNSGENLFCVECGTPISNTAAAFSDEQPTVYLLGGKSLSEIEDPAATLYYPSANTGNNEILPTEIFSAEEVLPTQNYSIAETSPNNDFPTASVSSANNQAVFNNSTPQSETKQFMAPNSVETVTVSKSEFQAAEEVIELKKKPKKFLKYLLFCGILLVFLIAGGGTAAYFLANPMQESRSYILTDKHEGPENTFTVDNLNNDFLMIAADNSKFQKWRITPTSNNKDLYRFVNRGLSLNESLEVVDDSQDSSIGIAKSAQDIGQYWAITNVNDDYYRITNQWLGDSKSLSHSKQYYFFLRVRDSNGNEGQLWKKTIAPNGQGFYLTSKKYGDTVFLQALNKDEFKDKLVMKSGEYGNRLWTLDDLGNGFYNLTTVGEGKSLEINQSKADRVIMASSTNTAKQRWKMIPQGNDYFSLTNESLGDGKSLEAVTFSRFHVGMVKSDDNDLGQLWKISRTN